MPILKCLFSIKIKPLVTLINISHFAKALHAWPDYPISYLGSSLGAPAKRGRQKNGRDLRKEIYDKETNSLMLISSQSVSQSHSFL